MNILFTLCGRAGSFVRKSISEKGIYSGNPAILKVKAK